MRKANSMGLVIGGLVVGGAVVGGMALARKKKSAAAQLPPGQATAGTTAQPALYPVPPIPEVPGTLPATVQQRVVAALQSGQAAEMRRVAAQLRAEGYAEAANSLDANATAQESNVAVVQGGLNKVAELLAKIVPGTAPAQPQPGTATPSPLPTSPPPAQPTLEQPAGSMGPPEAPKVAPPAAQPTLEQPGELTQVTVPGIPGLTQPVQYGVSTSLLTTLQQAIPGLAAGTASGQPTPAPAPLQTGAPAWPETNPVKIGVAQAMNINQASKSKGKEDKALTKQFQQQEGGKAGSVDGLYGPTVARDLGERYGIIPAPPKYWSSKTSAQSQKNSYNSWLSDMAAKDPVRASEWGAAAVF